ncbi:alpha beta-hydrolase [Roridomyces roridus]|uniref:Carboxylic ester hydrolase n=1 Tax=Roridomyces roridus TaxID=1738132 RepID=A0AAD7BT54_9AGAR|nr:alpha beta-hydrolase [Roridomyces roridus]
MLPLLLSGALAIVSCVASTHIVSLPYGTFRGVPQGNLTEFRSVPFAQAGRFELPRAPRHLHGIQNATVYGASCPQQTFSALPVELPGSDNDPQLTISEDCLTLDVYRPITANHKSKLPVLVWIFGGGFETGNTRDTDVKPVVERAIVTGQSVVSVVMNYRFTAFGFLAGKEVARAGISNLGLRDQIFALKWVQEHVAAFGGDPSRVVLGGVSAGAISASLLMLDNLEGSNKLFHGAILEAGSPGSEPSVLDGQDQYNFLVSANNCSHAHDTLECLRNVPFDAFMTTVNETPDLFSNKSLNTAWRPRVDGDVILANPLLMLQRGLFSKMPFLTGDSDDEGTIFTLALLNITTNSEFLNYVHANYFPAATEDQIAKMGHLYPNDPKKGSPFGTGTNNQLSPQFKRLASFQGDLIFVAPRRFFLEHASSRQNTWSWLSTAFKNSSELGSVHTSDDAILFPKTPDSDWTAADALINFINTLNPNRPADGSHHSALEVPWSKWHKKEPVSLTFSDTKVSVTADDFRAESMGYLNEVLLEEAEGEGVVCLVIVASSV